MSESTLLRVSLRSLSTSKVSVTTWLLSGGRKPNWSIGTPSDSNCLAFNMIFMYLLLSFAILAVGGHKIKETISFAFYWSKFNIWHLSLARKQALFILNVSQNIKLWTSSPITFSLHETQNLSEIGMVWYRPTCISRWWAPRRSLDSQQRWFLLLIRSR